MDYEAIIKELRADLFYQIEAKHGAEKASKYPSILKADEALKLVKNNEVLYLVSGCFYWVKHTETCEYEPAIAECRYEKDMLYFCFTCGGAVKCDSVVDYKKLNYC